MRRKDRSALSIRAAVQRSVLEPADGRFDEVLVAVTVRIEQDKSVGAQFGDALENLFFDIVHVGEVLKWHVIVVSRLGGEPFERVHNPYAVIGLAIELFDMHPKALDVQWCSEPRPVASVWTRCRRPACGRRRCRPSRPRRRKSHVAREQPAHMSEAISSQCYRLPIGFDSTDEPAPPLQGLCGPINLASDHAHTVDESLDGFMCFVAVEVVEHLMALLDGGNFVQRRVEGLEVIVDMPGGHRSDDFVEVQAGKAISCLQFTLCGLMVFLQPCLHVQAGDEFEPLLGVLLRGQPNAAREQGGL